MIVGLTGGIGCGKSTVAQLIRTMGYPVYNSDDRARYLQSHDPQLIQDMTELLGDDILKDGQLDRKAVAAKVFGEPDLLNQLNKLVHPRVKADFEEWVDRQQSPILFKESALLVETGLYRDGDALVLVEAPEKIRIQRVMERDGVSEKEVRSRIDRQATDAEKRDVADFIIDNGGDTLLIPQVEYLMEVLQKHIDV